MASSDAAEIRAIFGKDAFRLVARSRLPLPRPEKTYECATYTSPVFSFADFGVREVVEMRRRRAEGAAAAELHVKGVVAATEVTSQPDDASLLTFAVELSYKGECEGGAPNGVGTISSVLGVYEGEVVNGVPHGLGVFTSSLVGRYEGEWVSGQRCGHGQFVQSDQSVYRGEWAAGMKHGSGCEVDGEGVMVRGTWTSGVLTVRESSAGDSLEVQQRLALAQVRSYEQCLKPMPRFALPNPVLPKTPVALAVKKTAALLPAVHTARFDAQLARTIATLIKSGLYKRAPTPRTQASEAAMSQAYRFYKARKKAALRAMGDHVRFSGVFSMLRDGMHEALPQIVARTQVSANTVAAVDSWRTLAEAKVQRLNKLVSSTDRGKMELNGLGVPTVYRNRKLEGEED